MRKSRNWEIEKKRRKLRIKKIETRQNNSKQANRNFLSHLSEKVPMCGVNFTHVEPCIVRADGPVPYNERKGGRKEGRKEVRKEGGTTGRKRERQAGRKEGR
jgi:hypothetical protein